MGHNVSSNKVIVRPPKNGPDKGAETVSTSGDFNGNTREYNVKLHEDTRICDVTGCCVLTDDNLLLTDYTNKRLKKINVKSGKVSHIDLPNNPTDVCYISDEDNTAVVCGMRTLYFVHVKGQMRLLRDVSLDHECNGIAYGNNQLFIVDNTTLFLYTTKGNKKQSLYTDTTETSKFCHLAVSWDGTKVYVTDERAGILVCDSNGKLISKITDPDLREPQGICLDASGNVFVSGFESDTVIKVNSTGTKKIETVIRDTGEISDPKCLCIDKLNLYIGQWNDKLTMFQL